jgi:hypothetical protein
LDGAYSTIAFIKALDSDVGYATVVFKNVVINSTGTFSLSATSAELISGFIIQYGFDVLDKMYYYHLIQMK